MFITSRFPYPLNKGDKLRAYFQLKNLADDYEVYLIAINDKNIPESDLKAVSGFCNSVNVFNLPLYKRIIQLLLSPFKKLPLQVAFFYNPKIKNSIEKLVQEIKPDHIHCHLIRTAEYVKDIVGVPKSIDFMDAFGKGMEKRQSTERNYIKRILFRYETRMLNRYEASVFHFIDRFGIISNQDKNWIKSPRAEEIIIIPNGVDFDSFYPRSDEKKYDLVFMGNLDYPPNIVAVEFLTSEILPKLKKANPSIKLLIAGMGASKRIKNLQSGNIDVIEHFNHISDSIASARIMVAPMKIHIGLPNKVIQAMAMKTPCVVNSLTNNSIGAENNKSIIEAETPDEYAEAILDLLSDNNKASVVANAAYEFVKEHYSWKNQNRLFTKLIIQ